MSPDTIPEFAIVGHPNEGKSSVLSTLAEDDSVRISGTPGETVVCQEFPVIIDGKEIIRFIDTPGFQNPRKVLHQLQSLRGSTTNIIETFREKNIANPEFRGDCELLLPITKGAGIIYVVDGSRPVRSVDRAEMEILRLTGLPRMAILNSKDATTDFLEQWKEEFRKSFNVFRIFNAHTANYAQRIELLESLKNIDQDWQATLDTVIAAFIKDWAQRNLVSAGIMTDMLQECLACKIARNIPDSSPAEGIRADMIAAYEKKIRKIESRAHHKIRNLFKHNIFNYDLPSTSILQEDLFSESTWKFLGLTRAQQIAAAGIGGAGIAVALDAATLGTSFGMFATLGGLAGATWAALGTKGLARTKIMGMPLGGREIEVGPVKNIQFLYILLDRSLIYYSHISNWAHGRRDYGTDTGGREKGTARGGFAAQWDSGARSICSAFFKEATRGNVSTDHEAEQQMRDFLISQLQKISHSENIKMI
jgi:GTPase Era involved in 16S rRNA processing